MSKKVEALATEFEQIKTSVANIHNRAETESRDLTESEEADVTTLLARADQIKPLVEAEVAQETKLNDVAAIFARANRTNGTVENGSAKLNPAEYMFNYIRSLHPLGQHDEQINRALAVGSSSVAPGLLPYTVQGDIIKFVDAQRRTIDSLPHFPVPTGASFLRRVFTTGAVVAAQGSENTEIASGYPTVSYVTVNHATYAGGLRITLQADNFTDPSLGNIWLQDISEQYAIKTDTVVAAALKAAAVTTVPLPVSGATPQRVMQAIMTAADTVWSASKSEADTIWCSVAVKTWLATLVDSNGQFAFPMLAPSNRDGSMGQVGSLNSGLSIGGLRLVVDPLFASETFIVGAAKYGEVYESMYPMLAASVPSTLSREVAIAGELGTYFRSEGFVELVDTDGIVGATPNFG